MKRWEKWLHGLIGGFIGGAATAGCSWLGMAGAHAIGIQVQQLNLEELGVILLSGGIATSLAYLRQSPLPPLNGNGNGHGNGSASPPPAP